MRQTKGQIILYLYVALHNCLTLSNLRPSVAVCVQRFYERQAGCRSPQMEIGEAPESDLPTCSTDREIEMLRNISLTIGTSNETGEFHTCQYSRTLDDDFIPLGIFEATGCLSPCHKSHYIAVKDKDIIERKAATNSTRFITLRFTFKKVT